MGVAELVPAVAEGDGGGVGALDERPPRDRLEQQQVARLRLVPAGEEAVDRADAALGVIVRSVQPARGARSRRAPPRISSARVTVVPTAIDAPPGPAGGVDARRPSPAARRSARRTAARRTSSEETPVWSVEPRDADAAGRERVEHARRERPARARHLGAARDAGEDRLVRRPAGARPDRARSGSARRARRGSRGPPARRDRARLATAAGPEGQALRPRTRRFLRYAGRDGGPALCPSERRGRAAGEGEDLAGAAVDHAEAVAAQLDEPAAARRGSGWRSGAGPGRRPRARPRPPRGSSPTR